MTEFDPTYPPEKPSKSQRKRDMIALQEMGEQLVKLPLSQLELIPLNQTLNEAIRSARLLKSHEAKRRQLQYIGRLMRDVEIKPIEDALNKIFAKDTYSKAQFHKIERWRDTLIDQGDTSLDEFIVHFPNADRHYLRQLIRQAQKTGKSNIELFRYLRQVIEKSS